jgi:adhesin/invasin
MLYGSGQAGTRDTLPALGHFATQTVANGRVYVGTRTSLEAYGLFHTATINSGNAQTAQVATQLPLPIQVQVANPYNGQPDVGVTVNFSDGGKGGSFNPLSAISDSNGKVSTVYTLPKKSGTYTLTISGIGFATSTTTATATPGPTLKIIVWSGNKQTGGAGSNLPKPVAAKAQDAYLNGVAGVTVNFTANQGAVPNTPSAVTDATGVARTTLQLPTTVSTIAVTGSSTGFKNIAFTEYSVAGPASSTAVTGGNNQFAPAGTQLPQALTVLVTDQYGNPVPSVGVTFGDGGTGGGFASQNPVLTSTSGTAAQFYTLPSSPGTVTINATVTGVANPAVFTETGQ